MKRLCSVPYCVYAHSHQGVVFYVGFGFPMRPYKKEGRSPLWRKMVEEFGRYDVSILSWHNTRKEALKREREEIEARQPAANQILFDTPVRKKHPSTPIWGGRREGSGRKPDPNRCHCGNHSMERAITKSLRCRRPIENNS